jgi:tetratricopeptide (TPR) repeat protein
MAMINSRSWPASASDRLKAADDLNDLGKTAEANLAYAKALASTGIAEKQKISALGGLAVTFQSMGMKDQAKDAVEKILAINPRNGFALKLKAKLQ